MGLLIGIVANLRRLLAALWLLTVIGIIGLALFAHLANAFVIRSGSMAPAMPVGSLISVEPVRADQLALGDVVTVRADNDVIYTHRVVGLVGDVGSRYLVLQGDANKTPDPGLGPMTAVLGRVSHVVAGAGYLVAMLGSGSGQFSLIAFLLAGGLAFWFVEELEQSLAGGLESPRGALA